MSDLAKLLREKLGAARDDFADARAYTVSVGSGGGGGAITSASTSGVIGNYATWHGRLEEAETLVKQLDYILQRIVPNYDELVAQYRAVKDIEEAGK